jgi:hypothetical protein
MHLFYFLVQAASLYRFFIHIIDNKGGLWAITPISVSLEPAKTHKWQVSIALFNHY